MKKGALSVSFTLAEERSGHENNEAQPEENRESLGRDWERARIEQQVKNLAQRDAHKKTNHSSSRPFVISYSFHGKLGEEDVMATDRYTAIKLFKSKYPHLTFRSARDG